MTQQGGRQNGRERDGGWAGPGSREGVSHRPQARITKQSRAPVGVRLGLRGGNRVQILVLPLTSSGAPGGSPHVRVRGFPPLKTGLSTFSLAGGTGVRPVGGWRARAQRRLNLRWPFSGFSPESEARPPILPARVSVPQILRPEPSPTFPSTREVFE